MLGRRVFFFLAAAALVALAASVYLPAREQFDVAEPVVTGDQYRLQTVDCWFELDWRRSVRCARLHTPAQSGEFSLPVVVIEAENPTAATLPVLYLSGGPGDPGHTTADEMSNWLGWYERAGLTGDLVLVDRRGTGQSVPHLDCAAFTTFSRRILAKNIPLESELSQGRAVLQDCLTQLQRQGFDLAHYGTRQSAEDLQALMGALGYPRWHLFGVSYGTRLGLEILAQAPESIASAVLDSVYPQGKGSLTEWPWLLNLSLKQLFQYCPDAPECAMSPAAFEAKFWRALAALKQRPLRLTVKSWRGEPPMPVVVNDYRLLAAVFDALYDRVLIERIPAALDAALAHNAQGLMSLIEPFVNYAFDPQFNNMVFMAVECGEAPLVEEAEYADAVAAYPRLRPYTQDLWRFDTCRDWGAGKAAAARLADTEDKPANNRQAAAPLLLLAGGLDPITPSVWAEELHRQRPGSQLLLFPKAGHSVVGNADCAHGLLGDFYRQPRRPVSKARCPQP